MSWNATSNTAPWWRTLAFRLTAGYALAGLCLVSLATASLYLLLRTELEKSTDLFLADKLHVVRTLLRERPQDWGGLRRKLSWSPPPGNINNSIFACLTIVTPRF